MYRGLAIAAATITACTLIVYAVGTSADTASCPSGTVVITDAARADATAAGIPASAQCWNPSDTNTGQAAGAAKQWLAQHATANSNISCLNAQFAERLEVFMQAVPGGVPTITDGYRSIAGEQKAIASGASKLKNACSGYHLYGLAADFNNTSKTTLQWMRMNAPLYGLSPTGVNPITGCASSGFCDPGHIQMAGAIPAGMQCGICDASGGNGTLPAISVPSEPDDTYAPAAAAQYYCVTNLNPIIVVPSQTPPGIGCYNTQQMVQQRTIPAASLLPAQPAAMSPAVSPQQCAPQFSCVGNTIYLQTTSCTNQVYQTCPYGCSGTVCLPDPNATTTSPIIGTTYPIVVPSTTPALTMLQQFANPVIATPTASTVAPSFSSGIYDVISGLTSATTSSQLTNQNTPASGYSGQQTFSSTDLSQTQASYAPAPSGLISVLQNLQTALSHLFSYLISIGH